MNDKLFNKYGVRYFKFKNVKHSVVMQLAHIDNEGNCLLINVDYTSVLYREKIENLVELDNKYGLYSAKHDKVERKMKKNAKKTNESTL